MLRQMLRKNKHMKLSIRKNFLMNTPKNSKNITILYKTFNERGQIRHTNMKRSSSSILISNNYIITTNYLIIHNKNM